MKHSSVAEALRRGIRIKRSRGRSWGFVAWSPLVVDFGYLRFNRWWWRNLHARFALVYRVHYGKWPLYSEWNKRSASARATAPVATTKDVSLDASAEALRPRRRTKGTAR